MLNHRSDLWPDGNTYRNVRLLNALGPVRALNDKRLDGDREDEL